MIIVREATGSDAEGIRNVFLGCYGNDYGFPQFYDVEMLKRLIYAGDSLMLVAEESETGKVVGTASVILEIGAFAELVGEFGRLAVLPECRHHGIGRMLMQERLQRVRDRLHIGLVEGRAVHPFTMKIAQAHGFAVVGFLPLKLQLAQRESLALMVKYFGDCLALRRNHPRIIPEVYPLAHEAMLNCGIACDTIIDEDCAVYPQATHFTLEDMTTDAYTGLLRIERGRLKNREIFGPDRLHYGLFKLLAKKSRYLIAREDSRIAGAIGFNLDPVERVVRVFELISPHDDAIRFLLFELERFCRLEWSVAYIEIDVSAYAPRMQRTLLELGFSPAAYIPAMAFHDVERLDVVKMVRLLLPLELGVVCFTPSAQRVADIVLRGFHTIKVLPRIAEAVESVSLFCGLTEEQINRLAGICGIRQFEMGATIFKEGETATEMFVVLSGEANIYLEDASQPVGAVTTGECLGELSALSGASHSATATAKQSLEVATINHTDFAQLVRQRPDIGVQIYKNLAVGLGEKLRRSDTFIAYIAGQDPIPLADK